MLYRSPFKEAVGKNIGKDNTYIHRSAIDTLPPHLQKRVIEGMSLIPETWKWNFIITHPTYIAYTDAENFDKTYEPVLGARYKVLLDGTIKFEPKPNKPLILHQRYKTVKSEYKGFNIEDDKEREQWYKQYFDKKAMSGAGYLHNWQTMLKTIEGK